MASHWHGQASEFGQGLRCALVQIRVHCVRMGSEQKVIVMASEAKKMMRMFMRIVVAAMAIFLMNAASAPALTFNIQSLGGIPPANAVGGGNLDDIVKAAAHMWESVYSDPMSITLYYGWAPIGDAGNHTLITQGDTPNRELCGRILFDNSGSAPFYLDPTPYTNEEYLRYTEELQNLGGGYLNVARIYRNPVGAAFGHVDLLSVVLHEIGHALGLSSANASFIERGGSGVIDISDNFPYKGTMVPLAYNNSGIVPHIDATEVLYGSVMAGINGDERRIPSELDILANAQISEFTILSLYPQQEAPSDNVGTEGGSVFRRVPTASGVSGSSRAGRTKAARGIMNNSQSTSIQ
jgi:hypothetical protein